MSTAAISWMSSLLPVPQFSDDPVENSKQILKALKCVASSSHQVGDMLKRRRERLATRLQTASDETQLLRTHIVENVLVQRQRLELLKELQDDLERAQSLGNAELLKELADEQKLLKRENQHEQKLRHNLKRTLRRCVRKQKELSGLKHAADDSLVVFNCKNSLIQNMVKTCSKTEFLSTSELGYEEDVEEEEEDEDQFSESDYDLSDFLENDDMDVDSDADYPKLRVAQPDERDETSVSAWSFESDSQGSSRTGKDSRRRSVSFGPLPLSGREEENVDMTHLEEISDEEEEDHERSSRVDATESSGI